MPPLGECRPNSWVFQQLAARMGLEDEVFRWDATELLRELLDTDHAHLEGITAERLQRERSVRLNLPDDFRPYQAGSHHTDGKVHFSPAPRQQNFVCQPSSEFPYRLISPPGAFILNSSMGNIEALIKAAGGEPQVLIHPDVAAATSISDGQRAIVRSERGFITRRVKVTADARPGTVIAVGQWWPKLAPDGKGLNELTSQDLTDLGAGSLFGNTVVSIARAPE